MKNILKIAEYILLVFFVVLLIFLKEKFTTLLVIPCLFLLYIFYKKESIKNYTLFLFLVAFIIRIISIFVLKVEIADDFKTMYEASLSLLKGNIDFMNNSYFHTYPFQLGLTLYQALLLKIWNSTILLKIMNSIFTSFIVVFIYKIIKIFMEEKTARIISFSYLFYLYPIYLNSVLTNQHIPALLMLIVIYFVLAKEDNYKNALIIGLLLGLANFFRTESIIILLGIIIYKLVFINKESLKRIVIFLLVLTCTYFVFTNTTSFILKSSPLYKNDIVEEGKNSTYWKFYCGLSVEANGLYNDKDVETYFNSSDEKQLLLDRINQDKWKFPLLFLKKEVILWTQTNYDLRINNFSGLFYTIIQYFNQGFLNFVMILFVVSLIPKKEEEKKEILFIKLLIGIYYCVYFFIEISPRYAYNLHMLVFLLLGIGLERIIDWKWKKI